MILGVPLPVVLAELTATAALVALGLSAVIIDFGTGGIVTRSVPDAGARRAITGLVFGSIGATLAISPLGRESGAHLNPAVTLMFRIRGAISNRTALVYVVSQCVGAVVGAIPLLAWGSFGRSVAFGATLPGGGYPAWAVVGGEILATALLVVGLLVMLGHLRLRPFTPLLFPPLYAILVFLEAPVSGTSTNPARSLGPALVSGRWDGWWIYWVGPLAGTLLGLGLHRLLAPRRLIPEVAKIAHHDHDPHGLFGTLVAGADASADQRSSA